MMLNLARQLRMAIPAIGGRQWLGGVNYVQNLVKAVTSLPIHERPSVSLVIRDANLQEFSLFESAAHLVKEVIYVGGQPGVALAVAGRDVVTLAQDSELFARSDFFFPVLADVLPSVCAASWIADLQHKHLPQFFTPEQIAGREAMFRRISEQAPLTVFSSQDAASDFQRSYPDFRTTLRILPFRGSPEDGWYSASPISAQHRYGLPDAFLICCNQFWSHKNHLLLFQALSTLRKSGVSIPVVCTGPTDDYRDKGYFERLKRQLSELGIEDLVYILGVIPRSDQIQLLRRALAVVQPSLFEGWSTVVEDARLLGKSMVLSDLPVHYEQAPRNAVYFNRLSPESLATELHRVLPELRPGPKEEVEALARDEAIQLAREFGRRVVSLAVEAQILFGRPIKGVNEQHWRLLSEPLASDHSSARKQQEKTRHTSVSNRPSEAGPAVQSVTQIHLEGARLFEKGDWSGALAKLDQVLSLESRRPGINYLRGKCLKELGQLTEAKEAIELELKDQPNHPDAQRLLSDLDRLLCSQLPPPQTDNAQQQALQLCEQGSKLWQLGNAAEALARFDAALRLESALLGVHYARALCLEQLSRMGEAEAAVRMELQIQPSHADARNLFHKLRATQPTTQAARHAMSPTRIHKLATKAPVNEAFLQKQREFWNVNTMQEAMFQRVYSDRRILGLPPEQQLRSFLESADSSVQRIFRELPSQPSWKVLEIGCGVGRLVKPLRDLFAEVDGVDIAANMIEFARQYLADGRQNGRLLVNSGSDLCELASERYDLVFSMIVFQHIRSAAVVRGYFNEIFRVLKPGGWFRIQVYDRSNPGMGDFQEEAAPGAEHGMLGNGYTVEQLRDMLTQHRFEVTDLIHEKPWIWATVRRPNQAQAPTPRLGSSFLSSTLRLQPV